jgi:hypothetical protein
VIYWTKFKEAVMSKGINFGVIYKDGTSKMDYVVDIVAMSGDDPLAYAHGFVTAMRGEEISDEATRKKLAKAYIDGWYHGQRCRAKEEDPPVWFREVD